LSEQRRESIESQHLLRTIIEHIDVAIIALNEQNEINFFNPTARKLLLQDHDSSNEELLEQLAFVQSLTSGYDQVVELSLGFQHGRFHVYVEEFRESGLQHKLLFITDVRTLLRREERKAWRSLVRVISHEINNSLSPIASISQTLRRSISTHKTQPNTDQDLIEGLNIIFERANGLRQFIESYKALAKLPDPQIQLISITEALGKICQLFKLSHIEIETGEDVLIPIDPVQFEQVMINLLKNAVESIEQTNPKGRIKINWHCSGPYLKLLVCDQGAGISNSENLFVPFYSTKKNGSGIGLLLSQQIIEAHHGRISIANQSNQQGCCVTIELPLIYEQEPVNRTVSH